MLVLLAGFSIRLSTCSGTKWLLAAELGQQEMLVLLAGFSIRFFVPVQCRHLQQYCLCSCFVFNWDKWVYVFGGHEADNSVVTIYKLSITMWYINSLLYDIGDTDEVHVVLCHSLNCCQSGVPHLPDRRWRPLQSLCLPDNRWRPLRFMTYSLLKFLCVWCCVLQFGCTQPIQQIELINGRTGQYENTQLLVAWLYHWHICFYLTHAVICDIGHWHVLHNT